MSDIQDFPFGIEDVAELLHLKVRRHCSDGVYTDCPFCGDARGKMKINYPKNVWRCNYCGEHGGMLALYARLRGTSTSEAYRDICDSINNATNLRFFMPQHACIVKSGINNADRADNESVNRTLIALLSMLKLSELHRAHLRDKRGFTDEQIKQLGFKSTPPFYMRRQIADRLIEQGYTVEGVPGFYMKDGKWMVNFSTATAGILIPIKGIDGMIHGCQIRLDVPMRNDGDSKDKPGAKYIWFSSGSKPSGTPSGSPVHFIGDPFARVVYVTEGALKADAAHYMMNRTFIAIAGVNNTSQLDMMFALLSENGTQMIVEAADMDKYTNENVMRGVTKIQLYARNHGLEFRSLMWDERYKGVDDWQLAMKRRTNKE